MPVAPNPVRSPIPSSLRLVGPVVALLLAAACAKHGSDVPVSRQRVAVPRCTSELPKDPLEVTVLAREGAALVVRVGWLGGCNHHAFPACWYAAGEDDLVVRIGHDARGDACTSFFERTLELDLSGIPIELTRDRAPSGIVRLETPRRR